MPLPPGGHPAWNLYFGVEDTEATIARVAELGGQTVMLELAGRHSRGTENGVHFAVVFVPVGRQ